VTVAVTPRGEGSVLWKALTVICDGFELVTGALTSAMVVVRAVGPERLVCRCRGSRSRTGRG